MDSSTHHTLQKQARHADSHVGRLTGEHQKEGEKKDGGVEGGGVIGRRPQCKSERRNSLDPKPAFTNELMACVRCRGLHETTLPAVKITGGLLHAPGRRSGCSTCSVALQERARRALGFTCEETKQRVSFTLPWQFGHGKG